MPGRVRWCALLLLLAAGGGAAAEEKYAAREQVGRPVQAAEQLRKQKKFKEALAKLGEADAIPKKTPYEIYVIAATRAVVSLETSDYPETIKALETVLSTGVLQPQEAVKRLHTLAQLYYQTQAYPKVIDYANRYYKQEGKDREPRLLMAHAYYQQNDFANAAKTSLDVLGDNEKSGKPVDEAVLRLLAIAEYRQQNNAGYIDALARLVAVSAKKEDWAELLAAVQKKPGFAGRLALDVARLRAAIGIMDRPEQYMEAAQLALQLDLPGSAKSFLDRGYAAGVLGKGAGSERQQRLAEMASRQAEEDARALAQLSKEADAENNGLRAIRLGEAYSSYARYGEAIAAFEHGIRKGGLKYPGDARLHLGLALLAAGERAKAKDLLGSLTATDGTQELARLWLIQAGLK